MSIYIGGIIYLVVRDILVELAASSLRNISLHTLAWNSAKAHCDD